MAQRRWPLKGHIHDLFTAYQKAEGGKHHTFAKKAGLRPHRISPIMNHGAIPTESERIGIAKVLCVDPDDITFGHHPSGDRDAPNADGAPISMADAIARIAGMPLDPKVTWPHHQRFAAAIDILRKHVGIGNDDIIKGMGAKRKQDLGLMTEGKLEPSMAGITWIARMISAGPEIFTSHPIPAPRTIQDTVGSEGKGTADDESTQPMPSALPPAMPPATKKPFAQVSAAGLAEARAAIRSAMDLTRPVKSAVDQDVPPVSSAEALPDVEVSAPPLPEKEADAVTGRAIRKRRTEADRMPGVILADIPLDATGDKWPYAKRFAIAIARYRIAMGISTKELAERAGDICTYAALVSWTLERYAPHPVSAFRLATMMGLNPSLFGTDPSPDGKGVIVRCPWRFRGTLLDAGAIVPFPESGTVKPVRTKTPSIMANSIDTPSPAKSEVPAAMEAIAVATPAVDPAIPDALPDPDSEVASVSEAVPEPKKTPKPVAIATGPGIGGSMRTIEIVMASAEEASQIKLMAGMFYGRLSTTLSDDEVGEFVSELLEDYISGIEEAFRRKGKR